ncbi:hypothetical protein WJX84_010861 [Apatococcus fuscideae]|uniref:Uncharacterized protein n=1 Tax=Apatococcus fuscideae TaxID=2026836 RepID=A0AAW1T7D5_9CHLO
MPNSTRQRDSPTLLDKTSAPRSSEEPSLSKSKCLHLKRVAGSCGMNPQEERACLEWLLDTTSFELRWSTQLSRAADKAAAEGRINILAYLVHKARPHHNYPGWKYETLDTSQCEAAAAAGPILSDDIIMTEVVMFTTGP